ncbi:MaoC family dehydratase [Oceanicoccus sp. KOV_DT_Chl]|uniref:MaoC family dehydratase n=1 Tax=Oceanicoccus sp. KOV_DT_Chl TaxID=1904639 RepID=UPI000C7B779C|nr:MaoC family dehydratase [Oceanicoccus sp. KOV_DT_Chl]
MSQSTVFSINGQLLKIGHHIPEWEMASVSPEKMRTMAAILRDPNPLHWDRTAVAALPLGLGMRTINQGPLGLSYMINMLHCWTGPESIKRLHMTFPQVVLDGEHVVAKGTITQLRTEKNQALVDCDIWLEHQERGVLLSGNATVCLNTNDANPLNND